MPKNDILKLILSEVQDLKSEVRDVRQKDIPGLHAIAATLKTEMAHVKEKASTRTTIITAVGGMITVATVVAVNWLH